MSTTSALDELVLKLSRLKPLLEELAMQLRDANRREAAEARYANWTLEDIVEPALRELTFIEAAASAGRNPRDNDVRATISFFDHISRFASERQFPSDIDLDEFLALVSPAGSAAS